MNTIIIYHHFIIIIDLTSSVYVQIYNEYPNIKNPFRYIVINEYSDRMDIHSSPST